jgi:hypothetical protein
MIYNIPVRHVSVFKEMFVLLPKQYGYTQNHYI